MIGAKSIVATLKIVNNKDAFSPYKVQVQANKNYGLCDVILPGTPVEPEKTYIKLEKEERKKEKALYDARKAEYDKEMAKRKGIRNAVLGKLQGQPLHSDITIERLKRMLSELLNSTEL